MSLSSALIAKKYHPVILVGVATSGKTALLASLIRYLKADTATPLTFMIDGPLEETEAGENSHRLAKRFVNHIVNDFYDGELPKRTPVGDAYLIPLLIENNNGGEVARFAILELSGELLKIDRALDDLTQELPETMAQIFESYPESISLIFVGPYVTGDPLLSLSERYEKEFRDCDLALEGNLKLYRKHRKYKNNDNIMFLLSKWDAHTKGLASSEFLAPPQELVKNLIRARYPTAYAEFEKSAKSQGTWSKQFTVTPYSAGLLGDGFALPIPPEFQSTMNAYPRRLWNWLYENATGGKLYKEPPVSAAIRMKKFMQKILS